jgi:hypothetical protein
MTNHILNEATEKKKTIQDLQTFLCWLGSVDCKEEWFDTVSRHGPFNRSLDETIMDAIDRLTEEN